MKSRIHTAFRLPILSAITALIVLSCSERSDFVAITGLAQGGTYTVKINMRGIGISPREIKEGIDSILTTVDTTLSGYNKGSMLSRFNRGEKIRPNGMFFDIYDSARNLWTCTGGALDCAAGPLFDAWGFGFTNDTLPSREQVSSLLSSCGMKHLAADLRASIGPDGLLDPAKVSLSGTLPHLNYNAIAQGYSSDLVASYLRGLGDFLRRVEPWRKRVDHSHRQTRRRERHSRKGHLRDMAVERRPLLSGHVSEQPQILCQGRGEIFPYNRSPNRLPYPA